MVRQSVRELVRIDEALCSGCGICADACDEGAIGLVGGKAKLLRDDFCDGLGNCLPVCPTGAISFELREALPYDEAAVRANLEARAGAAGPVSGGLRQWPIQIRLVPSDAAFLDGADVLVAADCAGFACGNIHQDYIKDNVVLIGCPKLDTGPWAEKLSAIVKMNRLKSVTVLRMEVPCCSGIVKVVEDALKASRKDIPFAVVTVGTDGSTRPG